MAERKIRAGPLNRARVISPNRTQTSPNSNRTSRADENKSKTPPFSLLARQNDMVTVEIGEEQQVYRIHKPLLTHSSEYFEKALNGRWKEATEKRVVLEDVEPLIFDIYVNWLYSGKLPKEKRGWVDAVDREDGDEDSPDLVHEAGLAQIRTIKFANRILAVKFRAAANNYFVDAHGGVPRYEIITYAFENLPAESPVLDFLVDSHCTRWRQELDDKDGERLELRAALPHDFLFRVMKRYSDQFRNLKNVRENYLPWPLRRCAYHET